MDRTGIRAPPEIYPALGDYDAKQTCDKLCEVYCLLNYFCILIYKNECISLHVVNVILRVKVLKLFEFMR